MPKGPQGQKRPADTAAAAVTVARIATGEIIEIPSEVRGSAGGAARAGRLSAEERKEIASKAARTRWQNEIRSSDMQTPNTETVARGRKAVCMYPNNSLGSQKKELDAAFSGVDMLVKRFGK